MDTYALHLAMAALVGASFVAVSAYFMHRKTLNQLLEFAKSVERENNREESSDAGVDGELLQEQHNIIRRYPSSNRRSVQGRRKANGGYYRRSSASLPDVTAFSGGGIDGNGSLPVDGIPPGLPKLHTLPEGMGSTDSSSEF